MMERGIFNIESNESSTLDATLNNLQDNFPQNQQEAEQVQTALNAELHKLSLADRDSVLSDIHGVGNNHIEEALVVAKLEGFQRELSLLEEKAAYERALVLNRSYVEDQAFRLLFLRASDFDVKKAARKFVHYFEQKKELFVPQSSNDEILVRKVTWEDLGEADRLVVLSGAFQIGSKRDASGRTIFFFIPVAIQPSMKLENIFRAFWYTLMSALLSDSAMQTMGAVTVYINFQETNLPPNTLRGLIKVGLGIPMFNAAVHFGYTNSALHPAVVGLRLLLYATTLQQHNRFRFHFGSLEKIASELQTFGIPVDISPVALSSNREGSGGVSIAWHLEWLQGMLMLDCKEKVIADITSCSGDQEQVPVFRGKERQDMEEADHGEHQNQRQQMPGVSGHVEKKERNEPNRDEDQKQRQQMPIFQSNERSEVNESNCEEDRGQRQQMPVFESEVKTDLGEVKHGGEKQEQSDGNSNPLSRETNIDENIPVVPRKFDVLLGRAKTAQQHPGTLQCHQLIRTHWDAYEKASRRGKTIVADQVLAEIRRLKGRFLRWEKHADHADGGSWVVVRHGVARDRISHMFRHMREVEQGKRNWHMVKQSGGEGSADENATTASTLTSNASGSLLSNGNKTSREEDTSFDPSQAARRPKARKLAD